MGSRGRSASPARLVRLTSQRKHRCIMPYCGSSYGSQGLLLACRLPAALGAAGHAPSSPPGSPPLACHRRLRDRQLRAGRHHLATLVEAWAHEHNSFFSSAARGWQMAPCGAGDPCDCGRRARKSRWKATPAQNRRGSSCWSRKSRCCGLGTRSGIVRLKPLPSPAPPSPPPTLPSPSLRQAHRHRRPRVKHRHSCYRRERRFPVRRRRRPRCHRRLALAATTIAIAIAA